MMIADCKKYTSRRHLRHGFTLLEVIIVVTLFSILAAYILLGMREQMHLTTLQQYLQDLDTQGSRIMQEVTTRLRPAILPVPLNTDQEIFDLLNDDNDGLPSGEAWMDALAWNEVNKEGGMDSIAFVTPVDAQDDLDYVDDATHIEVGQIRSTGVSLDGVFEGDGVSEFKLKLTSPTCSLVRVKPDCFGIGAIGEAADISAWPDALYGLGSPPETSAFSVIRYVPVMEGGTPARIVESDIGVDLNGDYVLDDTFHIGKLQLVNVGGWHTVQPPRPPGPVPVSRLPISPDKETKYLPHETVDLSADFVLRNTNRTEDPPIFRLVQYSVGDITPDGKIVPSDPRDEDGTLALIVRVNLFNPHGNQILRTRAPHQQQNYLNRQFETVVALWNMAR